MSVKSWLKERFPIDYDKFVEINENIFIKEPIPIHMKKWWYCMGATPLILFTLQVLTGIFLAFYFVPSPEMAYESVRHITQDVRFGFWIRGLHRWGANLMILSLLLHITRVFFTRSYQRPREINWILGVILFGLTLTFSFTGYSMTYNQLSYWAATVGTNLIKNVPLIGEQLLFFLRGGTEITANTLTRFYMLHVWFLPLFLIFFLVLHIIVLRLHGVSEPEGFPKGKYFSFYPHHFYKIIIATLFLLAIMSSLTIILPPGIGVPADPTTTPFHIKPEWYFYPTYRFLRFVPLKVGIYTTIGFLTAFTFWPFIDPLLSKKNEVRRNISYGVGTLTLLITLALTIWESLV